MVQVLVIIMTILSAPISMLLMLQITLWIIGHFTKRKSATSKDAIPGSYTF